MKILLRTQEEFLKLSLIVDSICRERGARIVAVVPVCVERQAVNWKRYLRFLGPVGFVHWRFRSAWAKLKDMCG